MLRVAKDRIRGNDLPEPPGCIRIAGIQVRMVRLCGVAECSLERLSVVIPTNTKQIVKCFRSQFLRIPHDGHELTTTQSGAAASDKHHRPIKLQLITDWALSDIAR